MRAEENVVLERTDGNTAPLLVKLQRTTDDGVVVVADAATVAMEIITATGDVVSIAGVAEGQGRGIFAFPVATVPAGNASLKFDVDVTEGGTTVTYGRGRIVSHEKIGTP